MIVLKSPAEIQAMRRAGRLVAQAHELMAEAVRPGVTTGELDRLVEEFLHAHGAVSAFKGYRGFPASICTSVNEQVVHGIPGERVLQEGDVLSVDIGAVLDGFYGDAARTYGVGRVSAEARRLIRVTEEALARGIAQAVPGKRISDISCAIQAYVEGQGCSVVREFVGHGIGRQMHEEPQVPNFGQPGRGSRIKAGMTLAVEPMVNAGGPAVRILADRWTVVTEDGSLSAHFEHTIAVGGEGPEILTLP